MTLNYSLKNIPIPSNRLYLKKLTEMTESVLKRMRWRAFFFLRSDDEEVEQGEEQHYVAISNVRLTPTHAFN